MSISSQRIAAMELLDRLACSLVTCPKTSRICPVGSKSSLIGARKIDVSSA
uniref:Uncharacterized protein n=1 Tax=Arundo donax TaxID=35708 RepID=A0A0A9CJM5_ARUDO